jgi:hypothetical protein
LTLSGALAFILFFTFHEPRKFTSRLDLGRSDSGAGATLVRNHWLHPSCLLIRIRAVVCARHSVHKHFYSPPVG